MGINPIESAPKSERFIILQDEDFFVYEVARWSAEKGHWVGEEGEPIQITPTHWMPLPGASLAPSFDSLSGRGEGALRQAPRVGQYVGICVTAALAILLVPSFFGNFAGPTEKEGITVGEAASGATKNSQPDSSRVGDRTSDSLVKPSSATVASGTPEPPSPSSSDFSDIRTIARDAMPTGEISTEGKQITEQEPQNADVPTRDVASARAEVETLKVRTPPESSAPTSQATQISAAEHKEAVEQERQRGEALARGFVSAREEVEALTARVAVATAARFEAEQTLQAARASAAEQKQALERERQRGDTIAHELTSARQEVEALMRRVVATSAAYAETAQALQAAQASAAEQKQALEQERQRADGLARELSSAREEVEALTARFAAGIAARIEGGQTLQTAQPSATEQKQPLQQQPQRADGFEEFDASGDGSVPILARPAAPMIFARPTGPSPHARSDNAPRAASDMGARAPRERMAARSDLGEPWPHASIRSRPGAPIECLPAALRTVLTELEKRFGPVTIVSTTRLHSDNHSPGSIRANLHSACKAVDIKTSREPNEVIAYLRSRPEVGGVNTYRNGVVHFDLNANYKPAASKPGQ